MKPYYQDSLTTIYNADCMEVLPDISERVGCVLTSPPYNLGGFHNMHNGNNNQWNYRSYSDKMEERDYQGWQHDVCAYLADVCDGVMFYSHKNRIVDGEMISPLEWVRNTGWIIHQQVILSKNSGPNVDKRRFFPVHEVILVCFKDRKFKLNNSDCLTDVWYAKQTNRKDANHPAVMNFTAAMNCIKAAGSDVVLDPFAGSGTTGKAACGLGCKSILIEIDESNCESMASWFQTQF